MESAIQGSYDLGVCDTEFIWLWGVFVIQSSYDYGVCDTWFIWLWGVFVLQV